MSFSTWLRSFRTNTSSALRPASTSALHFKPCLEGLEERIVPTNITYNGGPLIAHVQVNNINMGPQPLDTTALMASLTRDYLPLLTPYYNVGAGVVHFAANAAPLPGNLSDAQVQNVIVQQINAGAVAPPDANQLYFTFLAQGQSVLGYPADAEGYHAAFFVYHDATGYHLPSAGNPPPPGSVPIPISYGVSFGQSVNQISQSASHELAEAVTDPQPLSGYADLGTSWDNSEVADIYEFEPSFTLDGYQVAMLSGPVGQKIFNPSPASPAPQATLQNLVTLAVQEAEAMAFHLIASIYPQFAGYAQMADAVLHSNPLYGTPQGQLGVTLGQQLYANWVSQL